MAVQFQPIVGDWYQTASGETFEVVASDPEEGSVEIQYFDGSVEELDLESWLDLEIIAIEPPEDWSGSLDIDRADYGVDLDDNTLPGWGSPLDGLDVNE